MPFCSLILLAAPYYKAQHIARIWSHCGDVLPMRHAVQMVKCEPTTPNCHNAVATDNKTRAT